MAQSDRSHGLVLVALTYWLKKRRRNLLCEVYDIVCPAVRTPLNMQFDVVVAEMGHVNVSFLTLRIVK